MALKYADAFCTPWIKHWSAEVGSDWVISDQYCNELIEPAFGANVDAKTRAFWTDRLKATYSGDSGRRRLRMCTINLRDRDSPRGRLDYVECPILWLHGTADVEYSVAHADTEIKLFPRAKSAELQRVEGGHHFLSATHPIEVTKHTRDFIHRWC